jgi:hypothetical protein
MELETYRSAAHPAIWTPVFIVVSVISFIVRYQVWSVNTNIAVLGTQSVALLARLSKPDVHSFQLFFLPTFLLPKKKHLE